MEKILLIGATGYVGSRLLHHLTPFAHIYPTGNQQPSLYQLDATDMIAARCLIAEIAPDIIIYAAGYKDVKGCETDALRAYTVNTVAPVMLAQHAQRAKFVYLSTDYVFDGSRGGWIETDPTNPQTAYGRSKARAEEELLKVHPNSLICRTAAIYDRHSPLLTWLVNELKRGHQTLAYNNIYNNPTYSGNLAQMILELCRKDRTGIYHTVGSQSVNRYQLFTYIAFAYSLNDQLLAEIECTDPLFPRNLSIVPHHELSSVDIATGLRSMLSEN